MQQLFLTIDVQLGICTGHYTHIVENKISNSTIRK